MRTAHTQPATRQGGFRVMNGAEARGEDVRRRRLALGIKSLREFADATGIDREALSRVEKGEAASGTYDRAEAWLDRTEAEDGGAPDGAASPIRLTFHDVYGIGEIIVEGPADRPDELTEAVAKLLEGIRAQATRRPNGGGE